MFGYFKRKKINKILADRAKMMGALQYYENLPPGRALTDKGHQDQAVRHACIAGYDEQLLQLGYNGPDISFVMARIMGKVKEKS